MTRLDCCVEQMADPMRGGPQTSWGREYRPPVGAHFCCKCGKRWVKVADSPDAWEPWPYGAERPGGEATRVDPAAWLAAPAEAGA